MQREGTVSYFCISFVIAPGPVSARLLHLRSVRKGKQTNRPNFRDDSSTRELELCYSFMWCYLSAEQFEMQWTKKRDDNVLDC